MRFIYACMEEKINAYRKIDDILKSTEESIYASSWDSILVSRCVLMVDVIGQLMRTRSHQFNPAVYNENKI